MRLVETTLASFFVQCNIFFIDRPDQSKNIHAAQSFACHESVIAPRQRLARLQLAPEVQVSCTTTSSKPGKRGSSRWKIQRASTSLVGFSSPSMSLR
jgi:hypothetical protein